MNRRPGEVGRYFFSAMISPVSYTTLFGCGNRNLSFEF